jgi:hypothetical protein
VRARRRAHETPAGVDRRQGDRLDRIAGEENRRVGSAAAAGRDVLARLTAHEPAQAVPRDGEVVADADAGERLGAGIGDEEGDDVAVLGEQLDAVRGGARDVTGVVGHADGKGARGRACGERAQGVCRSLAERDATERARGDVDREGAGRIGVVWPDRECGSPGGEGEGRAEEERAEREACAAGWDA